MKYLGDINWGRQSMPGTTTVPRIERRLAAILAADVAGYSRLMGADEVGTLTALKEHRSERIDPFIARHHGRVVKATGDGLLTEFPSVVDAVACAIAIQRAIFAFNAGIHVDRQIVLRIGINVGDIIIDGNDIFGDGVNVAARLEALCEPGGVCISRSANDQVRDKLSLAFADLGEQTVKNIARAVGVFGLTAKEIASLPEDALPQTPPPDQIQPQLRRYNAGLRVAGVTVLAAILAFSGWWTLRDRSAPATTTARVVSPPPVANSLQDRRRSIIVLPFENSSGDPAQNDIAAGITRDVMGLIARNTIPLVPEITATAYQGKSLDLRQIGREQDVHFVLMGSARRQDGHLIAAAQLFDAAAARQVWGEVYDLPDDAWAQHIIVQRIYESLWQATIDVEAARARHERPDSLDKHDLLNIALATPLGAPTKEHVQERIALVDRALALDPMFFEGLERQARFHAERVVLGYSSDPASDLAIAEKAASKMLEISPNSLNSLRAKSIVLRAQGNWNEAAAAERRVIEMQPLEAVRRYELGMIQMAQGQHNAALDSFRSAKRLAAGADPVWLFDTQIALADVAIGQLAEAISQARLATSEAPPDTGRAREFSWLALIAAESASGREAEASADLRVFLAKSPSLHSMAEIRKLAPLAANPNLLDGVQRAGMPAE
ncbi:MAG: adenylate/guanylate cyclase domain-containing protein [Acetobacteraceae bacterium]|nr:adenylate/guanylate cyclase domain-containing protein [Acetobacteraceae bacterium]